jgi:hypothetical protein
VYYLSLFHGIIILAFRLERTYCIRGICESLLPFGPQCALLDDAVEVELAKNEQSLGCSP